MREFNLDSGFIPNRALEKLIDSGTQVRDGFPNQTATPRPARRGTSGRRPTYPLMHNLEPVYEGVSINRTRPRIPPLYRGARRRSRESCDVVW